MCSGCNHKRKLIKLGRGIWKKWADLVEKFPAEVTSQHAAEWLSVPAQLHPAEVLLQSQLSTLQPWLGQSANQKTALLEVVQSFYTYWPKGGESVVPYITKIKILNVYYDYTTITTNHEINLVSCF